MRATTVWKQPRAWIVVLLGSLLAALATVSYLGPAADPEGDLKGLPLVLVMEDRGAEGPDGTVNIGERIARNVTEAAERDDRVAWTVVGTRDAARRALSTQDAYAALVVPRDFSQQALALLGSGQKPGRPALEIVSRRGVGAMAASMADKALRGTATQVSKEVGAELSARARAAEGKAGAAAAGRQAVQSTKGMQGASEAEAAQDAGTTAAVAAPSPGFLAMLEDPVQVIETTQGPEGVSAGSTSGILPLYFAVALLISGLLPATLLTILVDARLGYLPLEVGPRRLLRPAVRIARSSTFLAKALLGAVMGFAAGAVVAGIGLWSTDVNPRAGSQLVLFCGAACASVALVTLALFAVFGTPGQVLALLLLTLVGIPLSGGAVPVEALPGALDTLGALLPARHVVEGVRTFMFFDSGWDQVGQAWAVLGAYAAVSLVLGLGVSHWYDRKGYERAHDHEFQPTGATPAPTLS
ncbi:ABC transporter permease [Streptomyces sp. NPDC020792]|uniref:ABC transporter permease n=1 Tax=Streptomyces sp. NPDC020792 TaxID=3365089 RepID=UPI003799E23B